jgi:hypothetical protein
VPFHCGIVGNVTADYLMKTGTTMSQTYACKLSFNYAKLRIKRNIHADVSKYYAIGSQHKPWNKMIMNRYIIFDFARGDAVATFRLITGHDCPETHTACQCGSCAKKITP